MADARISVTDALKSRHLFGNFFAGSSWSVWRAVLKAANGEALTPDELVAFRAVAERDPPTKRVKELVCVVGRGGGKDAIASFIATLAAVTFQPKGRLRPGERASVFCIGCDKDQAAIAHRYIAGYFEQVPAFSKMVDDISAETIELNNRVTIETRANSYRSVRGRSILCSILDEVSFYRSENSANPDAELYGALRPSLARVSGSMMVLISSAHKRSGLLYQKFKDHYGKDDPDTLVVRGTTTQFNPTFDQGEIDKALASDPALYGAEYLSEWRDDLSAFIDRALVEAATDSGVVVRPPQQRRYVSFVDASGGRGDSFTCGIAHAEGQTAVLDCLIEIKSPFDPDIATRDIAIVLKSYGLRKTTADHYAAGWTVSAFARNGIKLEHSERNRSEIYLDCLPLFTSGRVRLIDNQRLAQQFVNLERRVFPSGQDKVNHPPGGHDDCCNSAAGALVLATACKPLIVSPGVLARARTLAPYSRGPSQGPRWFF